MRWVLVRTLAPWAQLQSGAGTVCGEHMVAGQALACWQPGWQHHTVTDWVVASIPVQRCYVTCRWLCSRLKDRAVFMQHGQPGKPLDAGFRPLQMADFEAFGIRPTWGADRSLDSAAAQPSSAANGEA